MSLSAHELILVLRARDEASRVLNNFSRNVGRFERGAQMQEIGAIKAARDADLAANAARLTSLNTLAARHKDDISQYQSRIQMIRTEQSVLTSRYNLEAQRIRSNGSTSKVMKERQLQGIRDVLQTRKNAATQEIADIQRTIQARKIYLRGITREIDLVQGAQTAIRTKANANIAAIQNEMRQQEALIAMEQARQHALFARGTALATVGVGIGAVGVAEVIVLNNMTKAASTYTQQAAKTQTQADKFKISLQELKDMGREVADEMPVQFDQIQDSMYDILSSLDLVGKSVQEKKEYFLQLTKAIGVASVAGQTDMETAGRSIIQILNAWGEEAGGVNKVNDIMFQLVRKGVGTYAEFAKTIGRAVPSARKAGQSVAGLAGMLAFMTRNGMSTAQASTSAARALDAISKTQTQKALKKIGIQVTDSKGRFRDMSVIAAELRDKLSGLSDKARAAKLNEIFGRGSGGTIQAMRFFNLAVKDSDGSLQSLTRAMKKSKGATKEAYDIMKNTPEAQAQALNNQYQILATTLGDELIPVKVQLMKYLVEILRWFNGLSEETKRNIAIFAALGAGLTILIGIVTIIVGGLFMLAAAGAAVGIGLGTVLLIIAAVVAAIATLAYAIYWVVTNWDTIVPWLQNLWNTIWGSIVSWATAVGEFFANLWNTYILPPLNALWESFQTLVATGLSIVIAIFQGKWGEIPGLIMSMLTKIAGFLSVGFANNVKLVQGWIVGMATAVANKGIEIINWFKGLPAQIITGLGNLSQLLVNAGKSILQGFWDGLIAMWNNVKTWITGIGDWIKQHKGPLSYDIKLLVPAGTAIMQGFYQSMVKGYQKTKRFVRSIAKDINAAAGGDDGYNPGSYFGSTPPPPSGGSTYNFDQKITTQEIDPRKHAADLAFEIVSALG